MDVVDLVGREPLFYAVANERVPLVHLLLLKDAPQDTRDNGGAFSAVIECLQWI